MPTRRSAGLLLHRRTAAGATEVLIGHMGGPLWARREDRAWSIPKGEHGPDEEPLAAACREFAEELGVPPPAGATTGAALDLGEVRQSGGKLVRVFAVAGDLDPGDVVPGTFTMTWPPRSGRQQEFPELDRVEWCDLPTASRRLVAAQTTFLDRLQDPPADPS